ncbi:GALNS isoform 4, partial [Pan troglodytes]
SAAGMGASGAPQPPNILLLLMDDMHVFRGQLLRACRCWCQAGRRQTDTFPT